MASPKPPRSGRPRNPPRSTRSPGDSTSTLHSILRRIDGGPWPSYRDLIGTHSLGEFRLTFDRIPPDPFAGPSLARLFIDRGSLRVPAGEFEDAEARLAVEDMVARDAAKHLAEVGSEADARNGTTQVRVQSLGASVLRRSACRLNEEGLELRLSIDLPAARRTVRGRAAWELMNVDLQRFAQRALLFSTARWERARSCVETLDDHRALQRQLPDKGLVAFLAEGSSLARAGGGKPGPRRDGLECPLKVPNDLAVELKDAAGAPVRGLGIPAGVTLIVGGAFHGKSTLLDAILEGVYPKHRDDGRERVVTRPDAVPIRAEEGRSVRSTDLSGFFGELPSGVDPARFETDKASGSTSQAAALLEAWELGCKLLLIDEDRAANNFMIRDGRMQRLVPRPDEPLIPFVDRAQELYREHGISTVLVSGGAGDYLEAADTVIQMHRFEPRRRTEDARRIVRETRTMRLEEPVAALRAPEPRVGRIAFGRSSGQRSTSCAARGLRTLRLGADTVELRGLEALVEPGQLALLAELIRQELERRPDDRQRETFVEWVDRISDTVGSNGLDALGSNELSYDWTEVRRWEIGAVLARWAAVSWEPAK